MDQPPREHELDGAWTGTLTFRGSSTPLQINLNLEGEGGTAVVFMDHEAPTDVELLEASFDRVRPSRIVMDFARSDDDEEGDDGDGQDDDSGEDDEEEDDGTDQDDEDDPTDDIDYDDVGDAPEDELESFVLRLRHREGNDLLRGRLRGDRRGRVELHRMDPDRPTQRIWIAEVGRGASSRPIVIQLLEPLPEEGDEGTTDFPRELSGTAWLDGVEGAIVGERMRRNVELTIDFPGESVEAALRLRRRNNQLRGRLMSSSSDQRVKLVPFGSNSGKPMKLRRARPRALDPDAVTLVTVRGRNFGAGATVHAAHEAVRIISVDLTNPRRLEALVEVAPEAADERIDLLAVNGDGQESIKPNALRVLEATDEDDGDDDDAVSFASGVQPIFSSSCALVGCHNDASAQEGLVLEAGAAYSNIVGVPSTQRPDLDRIEPGSPVDSYLIAKIRGDAGIQGGRMPLNRSPLTQQQIDTIVTWVQQQAPNNGADG